MLKQRVVIIGAPRSGTNMLRNVLCSFDGVATWPCDEVNYLWRHGNVRFPSDEIPASKATPRICEYIRRKFDLIAKKYNAHIVVEKTCANSLRVPFVEKVLPDVKYIFIYRDGIDATGSAKLRWTAKIDIPYLFEKVRFVPLWDIPYYAIKYLWNRLYRIFSSKKRLAFWGPALDNIGELLKKHSLNEVCAIQWQRCVESAENSFKNIPEERLIRIGYEEFVESPVENISKIMDFLGEEVTESDLIKSVAGVSKKSVGKGRAALSDSEVIKLESLVSDTLDRYGYK